MLKIAARGVRVRVLTNSLEATDVGAVHAGHSRYRKALLKGGVQIYELRREPGRTALRSIGLGVLSILPIEKLL